MTVPALYQRLLSWVDILSIHKSKGLEYEHVIIPFCDWDLEPKAGSMIWCKPEPIQDYSLPIVPIDYSSKALGGTRYETDYHKENFQNTVDNLNLLYVAFTRAGRSLFVIGTRASKSRRSYLLEVCLPIVLQKLSGSIIEGVDDKEAKLIFKYGQLDICNKEKAESKNLAFIFLCHLHRTILRSTINDDMLHILVSLLPYTIQGALQTFLGIIGYSDNRKAYHIL